MRQQYPQQNYNSRPQGPRGMQQRQPQQGGHAHQQNQQQHMSGVPGGGQPGQSGQSAQGQGSQGVGGGGPGGQAQHIRHQQGHQGQGGPQQMTAQQQAAVAAAAASYGSVATAYHQPPMMIFQAPPGQMSQAQATAAMQHYRYNVPNAYVQSHHMVPPNYFVATSLPLNQQVLAQQAQLYYQNQVGPSAHPQQAYYQQQQGVHAVYRQLAQAVPVGQAQVQQQQQQQQQVAVSQAHGGGAPHHPQQVQVQQVHQAQPTQVVQVAPPAVAGIPSLVTQVVHPQQQTMSMEQREQTQPPQPRKRKILQIVDPTTGKPVIDEDVRENAPSVSPQPTVEHVGGSASGSSSSGGGPNEISDENRPPSTTQVILNNNVGNVAKPKEEPSDSSNKSKDDDDKEIESKAAKAAFYQAITRLADDDKSGAKDVTTGRTSSTPEAIVVTQTQPIATPGTTPTPITTIAASAPPSSDTLPIALTPEPRPKDDTQTKEIPEPKVVDEPPPEIISPMLPELSSTIVNNKREPVTEIVVVDEPSSAPTDLSNMGSSGRGDEDSTTATTTTSTTEKDTSLISISPTPMDKYDSLLESPEKILQPPLTNTSPTVESGEPSSLGSSTRESTASPAARDDKVESVELELSLSTSPQNLETESQQQLPTPTQMNHLTKSLDNISIESESSASTAQPPQLKSSLGEPLQQNGENAEDLSEGDGSEEGDDEDEGELEEGELDEDSETSEPPKKTRITYDKSHLLQFQPKSAFDMNSIPRELIKDEKSSVANHMGFNRGSSPGGFGSSRPGAGGGSRDRRDKMGGLGGHLGMRGGPPMNMQWMGGMGQGIIIPPPPPRPPKVIEISREKVELHKAEKAWKPSTARGSKPDDRSEEQILTDEVVKKTRSILNKLTPENFDKLIDKFLQLQLEDNDDRIGAVIKVVFEKAIDEPSFSTAYAKMVAQVCGKSAETSKKFRKKILDQCQREFQTGNTDEEVLRELEAKIQASSDDKEKETLKVELDEKKFVSRRRSLGNVRFIGELFKFQMLTPKIMVECINMLLGNPDEENYECLCKLLTTIGQKLEDALKETENQSKMRQLKWIPEPQFMDKTFGKLKELSIQNSLSSRIRFALLDVYELRDNGWKPRRDANAPKTIEEVRRAAAKEEMEEKKQLMSLPSVPSSQPPRLMNQPTKKDGGWSTVQSSKSSRFSQMAKKPMPSAGDSNEPGSLMPKFAPASGWGMSQQGQGRLGGMGGGSGGNVSSSGNLQSSHKSTFERPPRFARLQDDRGPSGPPPSREEIVQEPPPPLRSSSSHSSRESSRSQTPTRGSSDQPWTRGGSDIPISQPQPSPTKSVPPLVPAPVPILPPPIENNVHGTANNHEATKNIFQEFFAVRSIEDTVGWINDRFPRSGNPNITDFVEELGNLVCDLTKEDHQKTAALLLKLIIKRGLITKNDVINALETRVVPLLPDMEVDIPKVTSYFAVFLVELFFDEVDLSWLIQLGTELVRVDPDSSTWPDLVTNTLQLFKLRRNEESIRILYKNTSESNKLPTQELPWITGDSVGSLSEKIKSVLQEKDCQNLGLILTENSWDLREELTVKSLIQAVCNICWKEEEGCPSWDLSKLQQLLSDIKFPDKTSYSSCWLQAKEFIKLHNVDKVSEETLWDLMYKNNLISKDTQRPK